MREEPSMCEKHYSQQYSTVALTTSSAAIADRYAYSAYGASTVCNASGTDIGTSAKDNRIAHTGREWDDELVLYHFRARLYDAGVGRFLGRDPIGYVGSFNLSQIFVGNPLIHVDASGFLQHSLVNGPSLNEPSCGKGCCCCCCCCPASLGVTINKEVVTGAGPRMKRGLELHFHATLLYSKCDALPPNVSETGYGCHLNWYEWIDRNDLWYGDGKPKKWQDVRRFPEAIETSVFDDWRKKARPKKCQPAKRVHILFVDEPSISGSSKDTGVGYIAIRIRGSSFKNNCKDNHLRVKLIWNADGKAPTLTRIDGVFPEPPGEPDPHF